MQGEALRAIQLDEEVFSWIVMALKASRHDTRKYHDERVTASQKQYQKLQDRLDKMSIDKLDGSVSQNQFDRMSESFRKEHSDLLRQIEKRQQANQTYLDEGIRLLELSQNVVSLYEKQGVQEKRRLLNFVCSNSQWEDGILIPTYRKPFDLLAVVNMSYTKTEAASPVENGLCPIWLPGPDSNQRPVG
jgi:site-specific DNA recombinase